VILFSSVALQLTLVQFVLVAQLTTNPHPTTSSALLHPHYRCFAVRGYRAVVVRLGVLPVLLFTTASLVRGQQPSSLDQLVRQFERETVFWRQFEVAQAIVAANDRGVLPKLSRG